MVKKLGSSSGSDEGTGSEADEPEEMDLGMNGRTTSGTFVGVIFFVAGVIKVIGAAYEATPLGLPADFDAGF